MNYLYWLQIGPNQIPLRDLPKLLKQLRALREIVA